MSFSADTFARFSDATILVVGDCMLDEFIYGDVRRISPEAPVPVVDVERIEYLPGGAANTAVNVRALGAKSRLIGFFGGDQEGEQLVESLNKWGVDSSGLVVCPGRPTTKKTRIVARGQQIVRMDVEASSALPSSLIDQLLLAVREAMPEVCCCVISDYAKGVLTDHQCRQVITEAQANSVPVLVDPKGRDFSKYSGATLVKPNHVETEIAVNRSIRNTLDLDLAANELRRSLAGAALLVTRGADGMSLYADEETVHLPTRAATVYDVTGAGDTVISTLAVALSAGAGFVAAADLANAAAALAVAKQGTTAVTISDLESHLAGAPAFPGE